MRRACRLEDRSCWTSAPASRPSRTGRSVFATASARVAGTSDLDGHRAGADPVRPARASAWPVDLPRFDVGDERGRLERAPRRAGDPGRRAAGDDRVRSRAGAVRRRPEGLPGDWPAGYDDPAPCTPAWQERSPAWTRHLVARIAREFARNAELTRGPLDDRMGAGTNHWFHSDQTYRTFLALLLLCGCEGVNGGGWAHYVGQEKVRPLAGWQTVAFALDWVRPPRHQAGTPFLYLATDQWRYERFQPDELASPLGAGCSRARHFADVQRARRRGSAGCRRTRALIASRSSSSTRRSARASSRPSTWSRSCARAGCVSRPRIPTRRRTTRG